MHEKRTYEKCILWMISVWSLFCSVRHIQVSVSLFFVYFVCYMFWIWCHLKRLVNICVIIHLWKHKNRVIRNMLPGRLRVSLKNLIYKEKYERVTKEKFFFWKFQKYTMQQLYFGTLVLASYCYCGDNI